MTKFNLKIKGLSLIIIGFFLLMGMPSSKADILFRPYLYNGTDSQMGDRVQATAPLADWAPNPASAQRLIKNFMAVDVLDQYAYHLFSKSPLLTVGPGFYRLSRVDQNRVVALVDYVYHGTQKIPGTIFIRDRDTRRVIGLYTASGLQLE